MQRWSYTLVAVLPFIGTGCGFSKIIQRNVVASPLYALTERAEHHRNERFAREAYIQMAMNFSDQEFSCDYRKGFVEGYTDYLDYGGVGEPPPLPSPMYGRFGYMTPEGLASMEDWKNGFRHGAATARASNLRDLVTVPVFWGPAYQPVATYRPRKKDPADDKKSSTPKKAEGSKDLMPIVKPADQPLDPLRQ